MTSHSAPYEATTPERPPWEKYAALLLPALCLLPFLNKAVHIDDTLFLLVAKHIMTDPFDFFGFQMVWSSEAEWVYDFNKNPPGLPYYLAAIMALFGSSEIILHLSQLPAAMLSGLGTYILARDLCRSPLLASSIATLTPAFLVSNANIMCESFMLAFYIWAVVFWRRGLTEKNNKYLALASLLIGIGFLVKFIIITAIPLLAAYTIAHERRVSRNLLYFLIAFVFFALYELTTMALYGTSFIGEIVGFAQRHTASPNAEPKTLKLLMNFSFTGGSFLTVFLLTPVAFGKRMNAITAAIALVIFATMFANGGFDSSYLMYDGAAVRWGFAIQTVLFITAGIAILLLATQDLLKTRSADSLLLFLLLLGIFVFNGYVNWTINVRTLLPIVPAAAILLVRGLETHAPSRSRKIAQRAALAVGAVLAMAVAHGDYAYANAVRSGAQQCEAKLGTPDTSVFYQGHWGFRYYMEDAGYDHLDLGPIGNLGVAANQDRDTLQLINVESGDWVISWVPHSILMISSDRIATQEEVAVTPRACVVTMSRKLGVGFYDRYYGPLPFLLGRPEPELFTVARIK